MCEDVLLFCHNIVLRTMEILIAARCFIESEVN